MQSPVCNIIYSNSELQKQHEMTALFNSFKVAIIIYSFSLDVTSCTASNHLASLVTSQEKVNDIRAFTADKRADFTDEARVCLLNFYCMHLL